MKSTAAIAIATLLLPVLACAGSITPDSPAQQTFPVIPLTIGGIGMTDIERLAQQLQLQVAALLMQVQQIRLNQTASVGSTVAAAGAGQPDPIKAGIIGSVKGASTVNCPVFLRTLKFDTRGADVQALQSFLYEQGLLTHEDVTGYYGYLTETAVQTYQFKHGILSGGDPASNGYGVAGAATQKSVFAVCSGSDE